METEDHLCERDYSLRFYQTLPFFLRRWWRESDPIKVGVHTFYESGAWRLQSDPRCDLAELDELDL